jgi:hypothetical protein
MEDYQQLKAELRDISDILDKLPPEVRIKAFDILMDRLSGTGKSTKQSPSSSIEKTEKTKNEQDGKTKSATKRKVTVESYKLDPDLDLRGGEMGISFKDFYNEKQPKSAFEFNAAAVYYLTNMMEFECASFEQVYTCYDEVRHRQPERFRQSFIDTKNKKGWIHIGKDDEITITHRGTVFVTQDLPKTKE